jgi:NAD(P)-dependent dehydrogenase (short-subunit alcohol dehydrogenase family)
MQLENQIAIVTGGGQGIGRQIALRLGQEGAVVAIADINEQGSRETAEMIGGKNARVIPAGGRPRLLKQAGYGGNEPLGMDAFSGALYGSQYDQVVFHESHDEAGNAGGTARTIVTAVNGCNIVQHAPGRVPHM